MDPGFTWINLKFFCDTAEKLSVTESAHMNFVTQSAISQGIRKLEKAFKTPLTNHSKHNLRLTPEGKIVFEKGKKILQSFKDIQDSIQNYSTTISGTVQIASTPSIAINFINRAMQSMNQKNPDVTLVLKIGSPDSVGKLVQTGLVDFGLVLASPEFRSFENTVLHHGLFSIFSSGQPPQNGVFIDEKNGLFVDVLKAKYRKKHKKELVILAELGSWELVAQFAQDGLGSGFVPDYLLKRYPNLCPSKEKTGLFPYELIAITNKEDTLSRAAKAFLEHFSRIADT